MLLGRRVGTDHQPMPAWWPGWVQSRSEAAQGLCQARGCSRFLALFRLVPRWHPGRPRQPCLCPEPFGSGAVCGSLFADGVCVCALPAELALAVRLLYGEAAAPLPSVCLQGPPHVRVADTRAPRARGERWLHCWHEKSPNSFVSGRSR